MSHSSSTYYFKRNEEKSNNNNIKILFPKIFNQSKLINNNILQVKKEIFNLNKFIVKPNNLEKNDSKINFKKSHILNPKIYYKNKNYNKNNELIIEIDNKANKIIKKLLSDDFKPKEYLKENKKNCLSENLYFIDPLKSIENNFQFNPKNKDLYKSYEFQLKSYGSEEIRNNILNGVNEYKLNIIKHHILKKPACYQSNHSIKNTNENEKRNFLKKKNKSSPYLNINNKRENIKSNINSYKNFTSRNNNLKVNYRIDEKIYKSMELAKKTLDRINKKSKEYIKTENFYNKIKEDIL